MAYEQRFVITKTEDGTINGLEALNNAYERLSHGRWVITLKRYQKIRSGLQNNYYFGCIIPCVIDGMVDAGFERHALSTNLIHEMLKAKFLKEEMVSHHGETVEVIKSTSDLSTIEFANYIEDIFRWAAEFLGINIPSPGQQSEINY